MRRWLPVLAAGGIGCACLALAGWRLAEGWTPDRARYPYQGLDVRGGEGPFEWRQLKAGGAAFVYHLATDGVRRDPAFEENWAALAAAGLGRGAIHRFSLCARAAAQARAFLALVPKTPDALPPALALEFAPDCPARPPRARLLAELKALIAAMEAQAGQPVLLRIAPDFERTYAASSALARPLWLSRNWFSPAYAARPWRMWQASDFHRIEGAPAPVHWDVIAP